MNPPVPAVQAAASAAELTVTCEARWLVAAFANVHRTASWALAGGGIARARQVAWHLVTESELRPPVDAKELLRARLAERGLPGAVGMMTSHRLDAYRDASAVHGTVTARCIVTVGLGNALRIGDPPGVAGRIGTINLLCRVSVSLTERGLLEALSLAAEARTAAVLRGGVASRRTGLPATGTGTDCIVIAAPLEGRGQDYAGKHTALGHVIGAAVEEAVFGGAAAWVREQREPPHSPEQRP
jgi:adenosylcobinamide amidohydrolase